MATTELQIRKLKLKKPSMTEKELNVKQLESIVDEATKQLLLRDFKLCLRTCNNGLSRAKHNFEDDSVQYCVECLAVIAIQAYAELDLWQSVLPFIQSVYQGIESCPPVVIQLCVLLHARVTEYAQCHAIASIWLRNPENSTKHGYSTVAQLFVTHVLIPQGKTEVITPFLDSCNALEPKVKQDIVILAKKLEGRMASTDVCEDIRRIGQIHRNKSQKGNGIVTHASGIAKSLGLFVIRKLSFVNLKMMAKVAAVAVCVYLVTLEANRGDLISNHSRVSVVLRGAMKLWRSLFNPGVR
ncbi:hypothetical protein ScPMuIL_008854 [Solemya velum]